MGKFAIIIVISLFFLLGYFVITMTNTATLTVRRNIEAFHYNTARNIANSAAQIVVKNVTEKLPGWVYVDHPLGKVPNHPMMSWVYWPELDGRYKIKEIIKGVDYLVFTIAGESQAYEYDAVIHMKKISTTSSIFDYAAYSKYDLSIYQNGYIDSYNSNIGNNLLANAHVGYGPAGVFTNNGTVNGTVSHKVEKDMTPMVDPGGGDPLVINGSMVITEGQYRVTQDISLSGNDLVQIEGDVVLYVEADISTTGNAEIRILPGSSLVIYLHGTLDNRGNGLVNETNVAGNMIIYGTDNCNILIDIQGSNNTTFTGAIYAPEAVIKIRGGNNFTFKGSVIGHSVDILRSLIYDEALASIGDEHSVASEQYYVLSWQ